MALINQPSNLRAWPLSLQAGFRFFLVFVAIAALITACNEESADSGETVSVALAGLNECNNELAELQNERNELIREKNERTKEGHTAEEIAEGEVIWEVWMWRWEMEENRELIVEKQSEIKILKDGNDTLASVAEPRVELSIPLELEKEFEKVRAQGAPKVPIDRQYGEGADGGDGQSKES